MPVKSWAGRMKSQIIEQLGQTDILLPALIAEGLAANDRVKARQPLKEGDWLSIDGETGAVYRARGKIKVARLDAELAEIESWRRMVA
jgi:hypothetical protein